MSYGDSPGDRPFWGPADGGHGAPAYTGRGEQAGYGAPPDSAGAAPRTYLRWAIAATVGGVLFCLIGGVPTGLASVYFARQVIPRWQAGDQQGARSAAAKARVWAIVSTVADVLGFFVAIYLISSGAANRVG
jgi:interferon-induced transmembrane protein